MKMIISFQRVIMIVPHQEIKDKGKTKDPAQFVKFFSVAFVGLILNTSIIYYITTILNPMFGLSPVLWANFAKVIATCAVLFWNFVGFKFFVFKK